MRRWALAACLMLPAAGAASANPQLVDAARASYVSLEREGLAQFTCAVALNWDAIIAVAFRAQPQAGKQVGAILGGRSLVATVGKDKLVQVTLAEAPPPGEQHAQLIELLASSATGMISGLLNVWSVYVVSSPFPASSGPFELADQAGQSLLTYVDGGNKVELTVGKDYLIHRMQSGFMGTSVVVQPAFTQTTRGLLLSAFQSEARSQPAEPAIAMHARFDYQQVEGFDLPKVITLNSGHGGTQLEVVATFSNCSVTKK